MNHPKPLAINLTQAQDVLREWQKTDLVGMLGFNYRFHPLVKALKKHIQANSTGDVFAVRSMFSTSTRAVPDWKKRRQRGGGVLLDLASHHVDILFFLFGQPVIEVSAVLRSLRSDDDTALLQLRLANDIVVDSFFSTNTVSEDKFEIFTQTARFAFDRHHSLGIEVHLTKRRRSVIQRLLQTSEFLIHNPKMLRKLTSQQYEPSYRAALSHFVASVRGECEPTPDLWDGFQSLSVIAAAEESARLGQAVKLSPPDPILNQ